MRNIEIDQSGKIEQSGDTFLAFAATDGQSFVIKIPARAKRTAFEVLRQRGKTKRRALLLLFSASLYLLLEDHLDELQQIVIDNEYIGHERHVKASLFRFFETNQRRFSGTIMIESIGKKSAAHAIVLSAFRGKVKVDMVVSERRLLDLVSKQKQ